MAAKLVAPNIETDFAQGFDTVTDLIKSSPHAEIASELEIAKAIQFLKTKDFSKAVETLKSFEKKDPKLVGTASTNLSFLYFLDGDFKQAEKYAELAIQTDRYNAKAQTNLGNCHFKKGNFEKAKIHYQEAVSVDALCTEAMYNLGLYYYSYPFRILIYEIGLVNKKLELYSESLVWFEKLHAILRNSAEVIYQIADV